MTLLLGDGAAGFSLMDVDTLVRHDLPVVMVMGNNSAWGLEKGPMQMLYGYDVVADLGQRTPYDDVVKALGGAGETVTDPKQIGPGARPGLRLRRALPRQRDHRRRGGLPAQHLRHLSRPSWWRCASRDPRSTSAVGELTVRAYAAYTRGPGDPYVARLRDAASRAEGAELWVAVDGDRLLGSVTYCPPGSPYREVAVPTRASSGCSPSTRTPAATGAGTALAAHCEERARAHGAVGMALSSLAAMTAAHRIYTRLGYAATPGATGRRCRGWSSSPSRKRF